MVLGLGGAPEKGGWSLAAEAAAVMRALIIVEVQERVEAALQGRATGEVAATEGHAPVLLLDRALVGVGHVTVSLDEDSEGSHDRVLSSPVPSDSRER